MSFWCIFEIFSFINSIISNGLGCLSSILTTLIWFWIYTKYGKKEEDDKDEEQMIEKGDDEEQ